MEVEWLSHGYWGEVSLSGRQRSEEFCSPRLRVRV